jgi:membrane dipeptidase
MENTPTLNYTDYRNYPALWAGRLDISQEAIELYLDSEVIDPHTVSYMWTRMIGYDMTKKHKFKPFGIPVVSQVDFPRCLEANMAGIVWDITTNPFHKAKNKLEVLRRNIELIIGDIEKYPNQFQHVVSYSDYRKARESNKVACWLSVQGGQAIDNNLDNLDKIPEIHRITLLHLTRSNIGMSSLNLKKNKGLSDFGRDFVRKMAEKKILVDLSHINRQGFFDALESVPDGIPVIVTHTGVKGVYDTWRNIDDEQIKAIAATGGTIGIIYYPKFLTKTRNTCSVDKIIDHMEHVIKVAGEDHVTLGSDYDGMITLPKELKDITFQPVLVQKMLDRNWQPERVKKILGGNFLRVIQQIRP